MKRLLVIGGASFDILHLRDGTVHSVGGAGLYTTMAARRCGALVSMFSPRPSPCPDSIAPVAERLSEWMGPVVDPEELPRFEISYRPRTTEYLNISLGAEAELLPDMLPEDLSIYDYIHITSLRDSSTQRSFIEACRRRGAKRISAGTYPREVSEHPEAVLEIAEQTDCFFMNQWEAITLFGSLASIKVKPGKLLYITAGAEGAYIIQGDHISKIPSAPAVELDPTGAGDSFCGAVLAYLLQNKHPVMAARYAASLAAEMIGQVGPAALLSTDPAPGPSLDPRVRANNIQIEKIAAMLSALSEVAPYPFVSPELPPVGHPKALEFFFAATLQQFSFWTTRNNRYSQPLLARIGGLERKGSDYLWQALNQQLELDDTFCSPGRQSNLSRQELLEVFRSDDGADVMPALDLHLEQAHSYGRDMLALGVTPQDLLREAQNAEKPLAALLSFLDHIGGYKEDPLRKKSSLLALILKDRPEGFLPIGPQEELAPIIDYHLMRSVLRTGLVDVIDEELKSKLISRQVISPEEEWAVRYLSYQVIAELTELSGKSAGAVDQFFFRSRKRCPEMSEPDCESCALDPVCAHRKELFQPVLRTSNY
ncbi:MAG: PfkB family carbohydrate kinase [Candidatus Promineifilaceae bacterium]